MRIRLVAMLLFTVFTVFGQEVYENDLFALESEVLVFSSTAELADHLKVNMPSTYMYFERLNVTAQKRVFEQYRENTSKDITEIILTEYRKRS